jgi:predicted TIM-barrel fold metal-dependent hydrolase
LFLFSTDYPHWQFDGDSVLPDKLSGALFRKVISENALATYPRLAKADRAMEISV